MPPIVPKAAPAPGARHVHVDFDAAGTAALLATLPPALRQKVVSGLKYVGEPMSLYESRVTIWTGACPVLKEACRFEVHAEVQPVIRAARVSEKVALIRGRALQALPETSRTRAEILAQLERILGMGEGPRAAASCQALAEGLVQRIERPALITLHADAVEAAGIVVDKTAG